jgi:hypothetical protein
MKLRVAHGFRDLRHRLVSIGFWEPDMRFLIRVVAILAAASVLMTVWFVAAFAARAGMGPLLRSGILGGLTLIGWVVTLVCGPIAAVQLWSFRESGRRAGIILFGSGLAYYLVGLFAVRASGASISQIVAAATMFSLPLLVLLSRSARPVFGGQMSVAAESRRAREQSTATRGSDY